MLKNLKVTLLISILAGSLSGYTITHFGSEFSFYKENGFDRIKAMKFALKGRPSVPELPAAYLKYIIPQDAQVKSIEVKQSDLTQISGSYMVYPAQPPCVIGETVPWIPPDPAIYNSDELFPGEFIKVVDQGVFDGARIVTVAVYPLQYRPKSGRVFLVRNLAFEFVFGSNTLPKIRPKIRGKYEQKVYDVALKDAVQNDHEISLYYDPPTLVEEGELGGPGPPYPRGPGVIITPDAFSSKFQSYADWMTDQGIKTVIISPQTIYNNFPGVDNAEKVRNYIINCYQYAGGTYFILGADDYDVPVRHASPNDYTSQPPEEWYIPCDMYFSDLTGNWDVDGDGIWGELTHDAADRYPEVYVGRITAYVAQEAENWVTKALHYEKTPGVIFNKALWVYQSGVGIGQAPNTFPSHFTHIYAEDYYADAALNEIDKGYAFLNVNCHGSPTNFTPTSYRYIRNWRSNPPDPTNAGLNWLTNKEKYLVGYTISCYCGAFDSWLSGNPTLPTDTCIADALVDAYLINAQSLIGPYGSTAYLANTRNGLFTFSHNLQYEFWDCIMTTGLLTPEPSLSRLAVAEAQSKCGPSIDWSNAYYRYVCYAHNLFGSPYSETWTKTPGDMSVTHPLMIFRNVQINFTVTVKDAKWLTPIQYAKVCLHKSQPGFTDIYEVGTTNASGQVTFTIKPRTTGIMKVTVTRAHNIDFNYTQYRPSQTYCEVIEGDGGPQEAASEEIPKILCVTGMPTILRKNTSIKFGVPIEGYISISLFDASGSRVRFIERRNLLPGYYQEKVKTENLSNGVYFFVLKQGTSKVMRKFILIK